MKYNNEHKNYVEEYWKKFGNKKKVNILNGTKNPKHLKLHIQIRHALN